MCRNRQIIIASIRQEALELASELINRNLADISSEEVNQISNRIVDQVNARMLQEFKGEDHSDSSENAREEIRIHLAVAQHLNEQHILDNRMITFDATGFRYIFTNTDNF